MTTLDQLERTDTGTQLPLTEITERLNEIGGWVPPASNNPLTDSDHEIRASDTPIFDGLASSFRIPEQWWWDERHKAVEAAIREEAEIAELEVLADEVRNTEVVVPIRDDVGFVTGNITVRGLNPAYFTIPEESYQRAEIEAMPSVSYGGHLYDQTEGFVIDPEVAEELRRRDQTQHDDAGFGSVLLYDDGTALLDDETIIVVRPRWWERLGNWLRVFG